jgi:hypothetical protein
MSLDSLLIHTCEIVRDVQTGEDALGNPVSQKTEAVYSGNCRLVESQERVWSDELRTASKVMSYKLLLPCGADLRERDRVQEVVLEDGSMIENYFVIKSVLARRSLHLNHLSVELERAA